MDDFERLVSIYRTRASSSVRSKLDMLMDIELARDSSVVPFLLEVLRDRQESLEVRIHVVKRLRIRNGFRAPADRQLVAKAVGDVLADKSNAELRLQAALSLAEFTEIDGVLSWLSAVSLARDASIDLRYAAFTSHTVERAAPTPEAIAVMRQIASDETLGDVARSVLSAWRVAQPHPDGEESSMTIRILLVDDHPVVRAGLRAVLDAESDLEVVGEADSGARAASLSQRLRPDIVLTDLLLPDSNARNTVWARRLACRRRLGRFHGR